MFKRKPRLEVVPESQYTDFSDRYEEKEKKGPSNAVLITAATGATASLTTMAVTKYTNPYINHTPPIPLPTEVVIEPANVITLPPELNPVFMQGIAGTPEIIQTSFIGDATLAAMATVFDPVVEMIVAISLPLASVVVAGAGLLMILGNSDKAQSMIVKAGIGYVVIQLLPLIITIFKTMGKAVAVG
ncbi:hypothetical protein [Sporosarcina highlanderae]|uniref:Uncharacterized protein n=1 Tax=Sporosarcina highlanderae TaxID=3035916 RepID=A0ABT8JY79_9BACL|nr:hypothetical protein [Sporosarcina highlanderae]MDN4609104.1 hypothetical protein [Sporosarcina highlanderae]